MSHDRTFTKMLWQRVNEQLEVEYDFFSYMKRCWLSIIVTDV